MIRRLRNLSKLIARHGIGAARPHLAMLARGISERSRYHRWVEKTRLAEDTIKALRGDIASWPTRPLISVIVPVYDTPEKWLRRCINSVREQVYDNWELCIADDRSTEPHVARTLQELAAADTRIKVAFRTENGHISAASNSALELAAGEFSVLLDHDDELPADSLYWVAKELIEHPETAMIYSDEDLIDESGRRSEPKFKPDFSRDLLYSLNLVTHLSAYRTSLLREIGGFRLGTEGSQDYDLALRVIERIDESRIRHIPRILYHWRSVPTSVASSVEAKPYAFDKAREVIGEHLHRVGLKAVVEPAVVNLNRVRYSLPERTTTDVIRAESSATAAELNALARASNADVLVFAESSLAPNTPDWIDELARLSMQEKIGAVGGQTLLRDRSVYDSGLILGGPELVRDAHRGYPAGNSGNFLRLGLIGNYSAVSWRCLAIRREVFAAIGGFDDVNFTRALFDADLCLRLSDQGYRIVYTPFAALTYDRRPEEPAPSSAEADHFSRRWRAVLRRDPFYNPNFKRSGEPFLIDI